MDFPGSSHNKKSACNVETWVRFLGWEDPLEKGMAIHFSILAWRIPWAEEPSGLHRMVLLRVGRDWVTNTVHFSSVAQLCLTLWNPMDCSMPGFPVHHQLQSLLKLMSIELVMPSNYLILCHHLLLPSIFPSFKIFYNESVLHIRWPKYWSFRFSISSSNEYSGLIFFRIDWFDLQGTLKKSSPTL